MDTNRFGKPNKAAGLKCDALTNKAANAAPTSPETISTAQRGWAAICDALAEDVLRDEMFPVAHETVSRMRKRLAGLTKTAASDEC